MVRKIQCKIISCLQCHVIRALHGFSGCGHVVVSQFYYCILIRSIVHLLAGYRILVLTSLPCVVAICGDPILKMEFIASGENHSEELLHEDALIMRERGLTFL